MKNKKYIYGFVLLCIFILGVQVVDAGDVYSYNEITKNSTRIEKRIHDTLFNMYRLLGKKEVKSIRVKVDTLNNLSGGYLEVHPMLQDIIFMLYEIIALFIGHNICAWFIVVSLTIWWVVPVIMVQNIGGGGFGFNFSRFQSIVDDNLKDIDWKEMVYQCGLLAFLVLPLAIIWAYLSAFVECIELGHPQGNYWERVREDIYDTYHTLRQRIVDSTFEVE